MKSSATKGNARGECKHAISIRQRVVFALRDGDNEPVRTLKDAREALDVKRHERREDRLPRQAIGLG